MILAKQKMGKFEKDAKILLDAIGGKENISAVSHCATRMRFVLADEKKADVKAIEAIPAVKGTFTNAGQFQVIIGNDVPIFYNDFSAVSGIEGVSKEAAKAAAKSNQNPVQRVMTMLAEIFTPIIPAIIVGGLILGFRNILEGVQIQALGQKIVDGVAQYAKDGTPVYNTIVEFHSFGAVLTLSCGFLVKRFSTFYQLELFGRFLVKWGLVRFLELSWESVWYLRNCSMLTQ